MTNWNEDQEMADLTAAFEQDQCNRIDPHPPNPSPCDALMEPPSITQISLNDDVPKTDAPSNEGNNNNDNAPIEHPQPEISTGARRRDPQYNKRPHKRTHRRRSQATYSGTNRRNIIVPTRSTSLLIGRKGARIRELEFTANVSIRIGKATGETTDICIFGSDEAIDKAEKMIRAIINSGSYSCYDPEQDPNTSNSYSIYYPEQSTSYSGYYQRRSFCYDSANISNYYQQQAPYSSTASTSSLYQLPQPLYSNLASISNLYPPQKPSLSNADFYQQQKPSSSSASNSSFHQPQHAYDSYTESASSVYPEQQQASISNTASTSNPSEPQQPPESDGTSTSSLISSPHQPTNPSNASSSGCPQQEQPGTSSANMMQIHTDKLINWEQLSAQFQRNRQERHLRILQMKKDFYIEDPVVTAMSSEAANEWRRNYNMQVRRNPFSPEGLRPVPNPVITFEQVFTHYPEILHKLYEEGFTNLTPLQSQTLPIILRGDDFICIAKPNTGRTLAVILSVLIHVDGQPIPKAKRGRPSVLLVVPTLKLLFQIHKEISKYAYRQIKSICLYKPGDRTEQLNLISTEADIIVATPTRLCELVCSKYIGTANFTFIALLEVEVMLKLGQEHKIRKALIDLREGKQVVMTSAGWHSRVMTLALSYLKNSIQLKLNPCERPCDDIIAHIANVTQRIEIVEEREKENVLLEFVHTMDPTDKVAIFCGNEDTGTHISLKLISQGLECRTLHGNVTEPANETALRDVLYGNVNILVTSGINAENINIQDFTHVVNLHCPAEIEEYVDRIGRSGRGGPYGITLTCITHSDWAYANEIVYVLRESRQVVPGELESMARMYEAMIDSKDHELRNQDAANPENDAERRDEK